jgi:hypothetical protein
VPNQLKVLAFVLIGEGVWRKTLLHTPNLVNLFKKAQLWGGIIFIYTKNVIYKNKKKKTFIGLLFFI